MPEAAILSSRFRFEAAFSAAIRAPKTPKRAAEGRHGQRRRMAAVPCRGAARVHGCVGESPGLSGLGRAASVAAIELAEGLGKRLRAAAEHQPALIAVSGLPCSATDGVIGSLQEIFDESALAPSPAPRSFSVRIRLHAARTGLRGGRNRVGLSALATPATFLFLRSISEGAIKGVHRDSCPFGNLLNTQSVTSGDVGDSLLPPAGQDLESDPNAAAAAEDDFAAEGICRPALTRRFAHRSCSLRTLRESVRCECDAERSEAR